MTFGLGSNEKLARCARPINPFGRLLRLGNYIDLEWKDAKIRSARLYAGISGPFRIRLENPEKMRFTLNGEKIRTVAGTDGTVCVEMKSGDLLEVHP